MTHQIIRNLSELKALDPDSIVQCSDQQTGSEPAWVLAYRIYSKPLGEYFPAVVLATGEHVRAARKALEEA